MWRSNTWQRHQEVKTDSSNKICLVVTTIGDGTFLDVYANKLAEEEISRDILVIVVADQKTAPRLFDKSKEVGARGINVLCPTLAEQDRFLRKLGGIQNIIPYNTGNRRNIGYLMALEMGCEVLISIDDDNFPETSSDFFKEHLVITQPRVEMEAVYSTNKWFNICELLTMQTQNIYPRGFPYRYRHQIPNIHSYTEEGRVHLNVGLWLKDPDVDAITWLASPTQALSFKGTSVLLGKDVWTPINTQNTAVHRDAIASYYFTRMGYPVTGLPIDRFGDIFSGYFCQACIRHLGYRVRVGTPVVHHIRNPHNHLRDLTKESACILLLEDITEWIQEVKLEGNTYIEAYMCLSDLLEDAVEGFSGFIWNDTTRGYFHYMAYCMRTWIKAIKTLEG